jgi:biopolymer transport protein ExbD
MSMSVGGEGGEDAPMSEINTTPLVDIMLVLLIIFLIAVPVALKVVPVSLPKLTYKPTASKAENLLLVVNGGQNGQKCGVFQGTTPVTDFNSLVKLAGDRYKLETDRLSPREKLNPDNYPEVHIRTDTNAAYKCVGAVLYAMQSASFTKIAFMSEPDRS